MISFTITDVSAMNHKEAAVLRAIADACDPPKKAAAFPTLNDVHVPGKIETTQVSSLASVGDFPPGKLLTGSMKIGDLSAITAVPLSIDTGAKGKSPLADQFLASVQGTAQRMGVTATLHPHDNPAVGAPDQHALADQVFSGGVVIPTNENAEPDPAVVFAGGSPLARLAELGAGVTSAITAMGVSVVTAQPDGASVFAPGEVHDLPNVQSGTLIPPPLPPAMPQTLPPPSGAAPIASPPPPPPPAPAPDSASAGVATTNGVQVDKAGLPWDARIHASTKTMTAKGVWTRRRGVEDSVVDQVEQQLRTAMSISAPAPAAWPFPTDSSSVTGNAPPPPPPASDAATFPSMMQFITERIGAGVLTQDQVQTAVRTTGLESLNLVMARPDLIPAIMTELRKVAP